jgi:topoisomerase IA-like protein
MAALDKDKVIEKFTLAYTNANGKAPSIEAKGGWYSVDGGKNMRLAQLDELADSLGSDAPAKAEAEPAKKAPAKKPAAKAAPKAAAKKAKTKSGFSVKAHWNEKIKAENAGAILPR